MFRRLAHFVLLPRWATPRFLFVVCALSAVLAMFLALAEEVGEGETHAIDTRVLLALHSQVTGGPVTPRILEETARDITALGSTSVLCLLVVTFFGFLLLARQYRSARAPESSRRSTKL